MESQNVLSGVIVVKFKTTVCLFYYCGTLPQNTTPNVVADRAPTVFGVANAVTHLYTN